MQIEVIIYAMQLAVEANKKQINYIKAILNNWSKSGIKTLLQAQEENQNFKKKDRQKEGNFTGRDYSKNDLNFLVKNFEEDSTNER